MRIATVVILLLNAVFEVTSLQVRPSFRPVLEATPLGIALAIVSVLAAVALIARWWPGVHAAFVALAGACFYGASMQHHAIFFAPKPDDPVLVGVMHFLHSWGEKTRALEPLAVGLLGVLIIRQAEPFVKRWLDEVIRLWREQKSTFWMIVLLFVEGATAAGPESALPKRELLTVAVYALGVAISLPLIAAVLRGHVIAVHLAKWFFIAELIPDAVIGLRDGKGLVVALIPAVGVWLCRRAIDELEYTPPQLLALHRELPG